MNIKKFLVLPHVKVHNANAWSSPYSAGFPSVCAFGGAVHALQRKYNEKGFGDLEITGFGVICHQFNMRAYQENKFSDLSVISAANPLDKNGNRPSFVPEIKCGMEISLLCELGKNNYDIEALEEIASCLVNCNFRIASGDVQGTGKPKIVNLNIESVEDEKYYKDIVQKLMPGYALIERRELMTKSMEQGNDALDALLEHVSVNAEPNINSDKLEINRRRKVQGWLVPICTGYAAISGCGTATNPRSIDTPHCFAESMVTLGEFKMLHRFQNIRSLVWHSIYDENNGTYCYSKKYIEEDDEDDDLSCCD
jgi:CRISPR-associated protein Csy2